MRYFIWLAVLLSITPAQSSVQLPADLIAKIIIRTEPTAVAVFEYGKVSKEWHKASEKDPVWAYLLERDLHFDLGVTYDMSSMLRLIKEGKLRPQDIVGWKTPYSAQNNFFQKLGTSIKARFGITSPPPSMPLFKVTYFNRKHIKWEIHAHVAAHLNKVQETTSIKDLSMADWKLLVADELLNCGHPDIKRRLSALRIACQLDKDFKCQPLLQQLADLGSKLAQNDLATLVGD